MSKDLYQRMRDNPRFNELVTKRSRLAWGLAILTLVIYYTYMMLVAFNPKVLHATLSEGSMLTVGVPAGAFIIFITWAMTGYYVWRANTEFDSLNEEIVKEAKK